MLQKYLVISHTKTLMSIGEKQETSHYLATLNQISTPQQCFFSLNLNLLNIFMHLHFQSSLDALGFIKVLISDTFELFSPYKEIDNILMTFVLC